MRETISIVSLVAMITAGIATPARSQTPADAGVSVAPSPPPSPAQSQEPEPTPVLHGPVLPLPGAALGERPASNDDYQSGWAAGRTEARRQKIYDWAAIGFGGGLLCSAAGCAGATAAGALVKPADWRVGLDAAAPEYLRGFDTGYRRELHLRRAKVAFLTGGLATVIGIVALFAYANAHPCKSNCSSSDDWHD